MRLRLRQLEALYTVAEIGSITRAADNLGISQPAVSRLLADLADQLGFKLFQRRNNLLEPTQETRYLLPDVERLLAHLDHIGELSQNLTEKKAGHLKIACLPGFATSHLPTVLSEFLRERPGISVTVEPDRPERILEWMLAEQYDLGITDSFAGHPAIRSEQIDVRTVCVFPLGHEFSEKDVVTVADMKQQKIIHARRDSQFFRELRELFSEQHIEMKSLVEVRQFTAACEYVSQNLGVSIVSELDAVGYTNRGIDFRPFEPTLPHRLALLQPIHKDPSLISLEFLDQLRESLAVFQT